MTYPGGKNGSGVYQQIINRIPPHKVYVEPFLGGSAVLRMKRPAAVNIAIDIDPEVIKSFCPDTTPNLTIGSRDALKYLKSTVFPPDTFIYCDPPYLFNTRKTKRKIYRFEFSEEDHTDLLNTLKSLKCMVMISGYSNTLYSAALRDWHTATFQTTNRAGSKTTETLWMNYSPPAHLHDYRYLGNNFRERERIKRRQDRWTSRLLAMPALERHALMDHIAKLDDACSHRQTERSAPVPIADHIDVIDDAGHNPPRTLRRQIK